MNLSLYHHPSFSVIAIEGDLVAVSVENVLDLFSMAATDQPLIVDLSGVGELDTAACIAIREELGARSGVASLAIVVESVDVSLSLVLHDVDRVAPLVRHRDDAVSLVTGVLVGRR